MDWNSIDNREKQRQAQAISYKHSVRKQQEEDKVLLILVLLRFYRFEDRTRK